MRTSRSLAGPKKLKSPCDIVRRERTSFEGYCRATRVPSACSRGRHFCEAKRVAAVLASVLQVTILTVIAFQNPERERVSRKGPEKGNEHESE